MHNTVTLESPLEKPVYNIVQVYRNLFSQIISNFFTQITFKSVPLEREKLLNALHQNMKKRIDCSTSMQKSFKYVTSSFPPLTRSTAYRAVTTCSWRHYNWSTLQWIHAVLPLWPLPVKTTGWSALYFTACLRYIQHESNTHTLLKHNLYI